MAELLSRLFDPDERIRVLRVYSFVALHRRAIGISLLLLALIIQKMSY